MKTATYGLIGRSRLGIVRGWMCSHCNEPLAGDAGEGEGQRHAILRVGLLRLPGDREGLVAYGVPPRVVKARGTARVGTLPERGKSTRGSGKSPFAGALLKGGEMVRRPFAVYCPRPGICGLLQRID